MTRTILLAAVLPALLGGRTLVGSPCDPGEPPRETFLHFGVAAFLDLDSGEHQSGRAARGLSEQGVGLWMGRAGVRLFTTGGRGWERGVGGAGAVAPAAGGVGGPRGGGGGGAPGGGPGGGPPPGAGRRP